MHLLIKPTTIHASTAYNEHSSYHEGDSGLDLFFTEEVNIPAGETKLISLGIKCEAFNDKNKEGHVSYYLYPRSSIAKTDLRLCNSVGVIDSGYRGEIIVKFDKQGNHCYELGDRVAQLMLVPIRSIQFVEVVNLPSSDRDVGGFGSTGN